MAAPSTLDSPTVRDALALARGRGRYDDAFGNYQRLIHELAELFPNPRILEVGGGRSPLVDLATIERLGCEYTINDIDRNELDRAPAGVRRMVGDIAAPGLVTAENRNHYDLVFSQMVFEHVADPAQAYHNLASMLRPGGLLVNFIPTYYALPFLLNRAAPEWLTSRLLLLVQPNRHQEGQPKFPAYYRWCTSTDRTLAKIRQAGFAQVDVLPFYGHGYYNKISPLHHFQEWVAGLVDRRHFKLGTAYAYVIAEGA